MSENFASARTRGSDSDVAVFAVVTSRDGMLRVFKDGAGEPVFFRDGAPIVIG